MSDLNPTAVTATIVYESMFGATRRIAEAVAEGIAAGATTTVVSVHDAADLAPADLLVIGAPTHAHSLSRPTSRADAEQWAAEPETELHMEPRFRESGVREWLPNAPEPRLGFAAFDTRADMPRAFTGSAGVAIDKRLRKRGMHAVTKPRDFLVDRNSALLPGELDAAREWGRQLAALLDAAPARP